MNRTIFACALSAFAALAHAGGVQTLDAIEVVEIRAARSDGLSGEAASASEGTVSARQLENRPLLRPAEVLEVVPGLIISQHSGDGKANQYYLRGFNLDHGTDFAATLMGMPVNMPTHAHGQGYADLQYLIPELVERMQYRKGPYAAEAGDFAAAGSASIDYFRNRPNAIAELTADSYGYQRGLLLGSGQEAFGHLLYALEWTADNGPWVLPEGLAKLNGLLRYSDGSRDNGWSLAAMAYQARWSSTDQVPQRAIESGLIPRYGNIDPSDGGETRRMSLSAEWSEKDAGRWSRANVYVIDYRLDLWSDFTYCLNDIALTGNCRRGDQFEQQDQRRVYGANAARTWYGDWAGRAAEVTLGLQSRFDDIGRLGLYATTARQRWGTVSQDQVEEGSLSFYGESRMAWHDKFRSILGLREDFYSFAVNSNNAQNSGKVQASIASPKLSLIFGPWDRTEYYVNAGYGFHSNDARGVTIKINPDFRDPAFGAPLAASPPLVRAKGYELGVRSALVPGLQTSFALWRLELASELLFQGDAGTTAPSFPSRRSGVEWANYWTPTSGLTVDADLAASTARYTTIDPALVPGNYIPGAIAKTASLGISADPGGKWGGWDSWSGGLRLRYFGSRPLIEDNSVRSPSSLLVNLRASYQAGVKQKWSLDLLNLFNRKASDIDYYYASQLKNETAPVNDIHSHPAEPRTVRLSLRLGF